MRKSRGLRQGTRRKLRKKVREKTTVNQFLKEFKKGEKVMIKIEPSSHRGMPYSKFKGKIGEVVKKEGKSIVVKFKDGEKEKRINTFPEHLRPVGG